MTYTIIIQTTSGSEKWELPFKSFSFSEELNRDRNANISFDYEVVKTTADGYSITPEYIISGAFREVYIKDSAANTIYSGYISDLQFSRGKDDKGSISVTSKGFFSLLDKRFTNSLRTYSAQDIASIIEDLLNYTQALTYGDFGITMNSVPTTRNADRTFKYRNIKECIEKMSNNEIDDGVDFEVDNTKDLVVYYPEKGTYRRNIVLEENFNIDTYNIRKIFIDGMTNQVTVFGEGVDADNQPVEVRDAANIYKSNFFLLQSQIQEIDVKETATLQNKGDRYLEDYKAPRYTISVTGSYDVIPYNDFSLGDRLRVVIPSYQIDTFYRVIKRNVDNNSNVTLSLFAL